MNVKVDAFTVIVGGAIVLAAARLITGGTNPPTPAGSTAPPVDDYLVTPLNDDEYSDVLDDELFGSVMA